MRSFSRWLLRRRRAKWLEELEEGIRKTGRFLGLQIRTSPRWHRHWDETSSFWTNSSLHPFSDRMGTRFGKRRVKWRSCSTRIHLDRLQTRASGASGPWCKRNDRDSSGRGSSRLQSHTETTSPCPQFVAHALLGPYQVACGCFSCGRLSCAEKRYHALGYKPPVGSQLTETKYAIIACLESSSRCMEWVIPKPGKVGFESCRLVHGMCDFWKAWHCGLFLEGTLPELPSYCYGFQRARRREGAVSSHLALAARCQHESISFVDESLDMATPSVRWTEKSRKT